ncbi:TPA: hypothetical protein REU56_002944, partial [Listeria monocytogenes]|nr:hypothetical protein [Listeria monocytogenes]
AKVVGTAALEGGQEALQEVISAKAQGKKVDRNAVAESGAMGAIMGAGMTAATHLGETVAERNSRRHDPITQALGEDGDPVDIVTSNVRQRMSQDLKNEVNDMEEKLKEQGKSPDEIQNHINNFIQTTDEGAALFEVEANRI